MQYIQIIKDLRKSKKLNQTEVAEYLGIKQKQYSRYETGENELPIRHLIKLSKFYGVTTDYILGLSENSGI